MAKLLKLRRGSTTQHASFTGAEGEVTIDTTKDTAVVHDGSQAGGRPLAREDMANVSSASIAGRLGTDSIAVGKVAAGTLPSDVKIVDANVSGNLTIESADIVNGTIVNDDINASAAIANSKLADSGVSAGSVGSSSAIPVITVNAKGIITGTSTTAIDSTTIANGTSNVAVANNGDITTTRSGTARLVVDDAGVDVTGTLNVTQNGGFTGGCSAASFTTNSGGLIINSTTPTISMVDSDANPDYEIKVNGGIFDVRDSTNSASRFSISSNGEVNSQGKLNCQAGLDTDGDVVLNSDTTNVGITFDASTSNLNLSDSQSLSFGDHSTTGDYNLSYVNGSDFNIVGQSGGSGDLVLGTYANAAVTKTLVSKRSNNALELYFANSKKLETVTGGISVTGDITVSGSVDGADVAAMNTKLSGIEAGATADQSAAEIRTLVDLATDSNVFTNALQGKLNGIETGATADQTGAEIATALGAQNIYTTGVLGRDSSDYIGWTDNSHLDVYVNGSNVARFEADSDFHSDGDVIAYSTTIASDENLKKDITTVTDAVTKAEALKGVTFTWKKDDKKSAGVIAQDVEKVLPEAVRTISDFDGNEFKAVNYGALTSILIEAVKELSAKVKALEAK